MRKTLVLLMTGAYFWLDLSSGLEVALQAPAVNTVGKTMPSDAAPLSRQIYRHMYPEPRTLDVSANIYEASGSLTFFDPLVKQNTNHQLIPSAAETWEVSPDGRRWTFHLREGARWSDGRSLTAYDFEYTVRRLLDPTTANPYAFFYYDIAGASEYNRGVAGPDDLGVRALDATTFEITTDEPKAYFPYIMAFHGASPAPRWAISKHGPKWTDPGNFVSNGSYTLQSWRAGDRITMVLDPGYDGPNKGYVEEIHWIFSPTLGSVGILPYENGEVDRVAPVDVVDMVRVSQDPELREQLVQVADGTTWYLFFKTDRPPFDDLRVRKAIAHSIDRETITRVVLRGAGVPAYTMLPPGFPGYLAQKYESYQQYAPETAQMLLASAGYPQGKGFPRMELWLRAPTPAIRQCAEAIQGMLAENLGITVRIIQQDMPSYMDRMYQWSIPAGLIRFGPDFPDPHSNLGMLWRSQSRGIARHDWNNSQFDDLVDRAARTMDPEERLLLYDESQRILSEDVGAVFIFHEIVSELRKPWLKGIEKTKYGNYPFPYLTEIYIGNEVLSP